MLKQHINWTAEDQRLFEEADINKDIFLDYMTQEISEQEKRNMNKSEIVERLVRAVRHDGYKNIWEIEGIERWIGTRGFYQQFSDMWDDKVKKYFFGRAEELHGHTAFPPRLRTHH